MQQHVDIGFELEVINVNPKRLAAHLTSVGIHSVYGATPTIGDLYWGVGTDCSMNNNPSNSAEIRSIVNPSITEITKLVKHTKELGAETNSRCGLHIHVSHPTRS